MKDIVENCRQT